MMSRLFFSRWQPRLVPSLFRVTIFLLLFGDPVYAASLSLSLDSEGRIISPVTTAAVTRRQAHRARPDGVELLHDTEYEYYPVSGRTFSEIVRAVGESGPYNKDRTGRQPCRVDWSATLSFQYDFSYAFDEENRKLHAATEMSAIALEDTSIVTLPSLLDDTALNPVEKNMWRAYLTNLTEHCHTIVALIRDQQARKAVGDRLADITYLIFDYAEGMDIEKSVGSVLRDEALRIGRESVREIKARIAIYEQSAAEGKDRSGTKAKTKGADR
ncbi:MAG: hypothetical protein C0402_12975 [Thermodesulfovibrio sp.]|nr:hypothetical protein [Thermodesulfovibrio sp.]